MIPYNTDAPIYYWPYATVSVIVVNFVVFFAMLTALSADPEYVDGEDSVPGVSIQLGENGLPTVVQSEPDTSWLDNLILQYGTIKPWQWFTSIFMHADFGHVFFNMIFLWAFGLIVEGKVGHLRFLALYLGIGVGQSALEQILMFFANEGGSLGASAAIAGLLGLVLVWAPRNEFDCWFRFTSLEIPVTVFAGLWLLQQVVFMCLGGFAHVTSELLHLMGFAFGFAAGIVWVNKGWVDCEGWDLISVWKGTEGRRLEREAEDAEVAKLLGRRPANVGATTAQATTPTAPWESGNPQTSTGSVGRGVAPSPNRSTVDSTTRPSESSAHSRNATSTSGAGKKPIAQSTRSSKGSVEKKSSGSQGSPVPGAGSLSPSNGSNREQVTNLIRAGNLTEAESLFSKLKSHDPKLQWQLEELSILVKTSIGEKDYRRAKVYLQSTIELFPSQADTARFALARIYLHEQRPSRVIALYRNQNLALLDESHQLQVRKVIAAAKKQQADGVIELADS